MAQEQTRMQMVLPVTRLYILKYKKKKKKNNKKKKKKKEKYLMHSIIITIQNLLIYTLSLSLSLSLSSFVRNTQYYYTSSL